MDSLSKAAREFGKRGGQARAKKLTKQERQDSARRAAQARWAKVKKEKA
jgi:hypothetical protein